MFLEMMYVSCTYVACVLMLCSVTFMNASACLNPASNAPIPVLTLTDFEVALNP